MCRQPPDHQAPYTLIYPAHCPLAQPRTNWLFAPGLNAGVVGSTKCCVHPTGKAADTCVHGMKNGQIGQSVYRRDAGQSRVRLVNGELVGWYGSRRCSAACFTGLHGQRLAQVRSV